MAKKSIYNENEILEVFGEMVLVEGYSKTTMRGVAERLQMPVSSLYRHFSSKEEMLDLYVEPAICMFHGMYDSASERYFSYLDEVDIETVFAMQSVDRETLEFIFSNFNKFKILFFNAKGTKYDHFFNDLIELELNTTLNFFSLARNKGIYVREINPQFLKAIIESNFNAITSIIKEEMTFDEALLYIEELGRFQKAGFTELLLK